MLRASECACAPRTNPPQFLVSFAGKNSILITRRGEGTSAMRHRHKPGDTRFFGPRSHKPGQWLRPGGRRGGEGWARYDGFMDLIKSTRGIGPRGIWRAGLPTPRSTQPQPSHPLVQLPTPCATARRGRCPVVGMQSWCISPSPPFLLACFLPCHPLRLGTGETRDSRREGKGERVRSCFAVANGLDGLGQFSLPFNDCLPALYLLPTFSTAFLNSALFQEKFCSRVIFFFFFSLETRASTLCIFFRYV